MKYIISIWFSSILFLASSFAYTPTSKDTNALKVVYNLIDQISDNDLVSIEWYLEDVVERFVDHPRKLWLANDLLQYIDGVQASRVVVIDNRVMVKNGDSIWVDYKWALTDGSVFDTSIESVAREAWLYNPARPYEPLSFRVWAGEMIAWFDAGVVGMKIWDTKTLTIPPELGYGVSWSHFLAWETLMFEVTLVSVE